MYPFTVYLQKVSCTNSLFKTSPATYLIHSFAGNHLGAQSILSFESLARRRAGPLDALSEAAAILEKPDAIERAYLARELVQCTLPHRDPGNVPVWTRQNGNLLLGLQPGPNLDTGESLGYPYGTIPRLLLIWLISEAVYRKDRFPLHEARRIELEASSLSEFMRKVGLNPKTGGGKRGDAARLREQMSRLFSCRIALQETTPRTRGGGDRSRPSKFLEISPDHVIWWNHERPDDASLFGSYVELGEKFFLGVTAAPVPLDLRILRMLKRSPLALDLYGWLCHRVYTVNKSERQQSISYAALMEQIGADYTSLDEFARKTKAALYKIEKFWRANGLLITYERGGIILKPGSILSVPTSAHRFGGAHPIP